MHLRFQPWQLAALLIVVCGLALAGVYAYRVRGGGSPEALASYLPLTEGTLVYIDVDGVRRSGMLKLVAGAKTVEEPDYKKFVDETHFDYTQDLDAVAALFKPGQVFMTLRGRFDWKNLISYVTHQGGSCVNGFCAVQGSTSDRRISFYPVQSNIMALAISSDSWAAYQISKKSGHLPVAAPSEAVWAVLSGNALKDFSTLPSGTKAFASALENADLLVFRLGPSGDHLQLAVDVTCRNQEKASTLLVGLEGTTNTLRSWISREHKEANPNDLSGVLTSGSFRRDDRRVYGSWQLQRGFIESIAGGTYQ
ncbi:MAG TPA: hypothetical protein VKU01_03625 [Bryobacteraceae bacterium]|nr:hypothetical protein [Bryobacteraceae bacterium]